MKQPRAIYIAYDVFPRAKGSSSHIASMIECLSASYKPTWLLCCGFGDMPAVQLEGDLTIHRFKLYHPNFLMRAAAFGDFVAQKIDIAGDEVEQVFFRDPWGGFPALRKELPCPYFFEVNALPSRELPYAFPQIISNYALLEKIRDMERFCLLACDRIITVSEVTKSALDRLGAEPEKISVIHNSASKIFFAARSEDSPIKELEKGRWFGYVGGLHYWQGVDLLVDAFAEIADYLLDVNLVIVTGGRKDEVKLLKKRIRKRGLTERVLVHAPLDPASLAQVIKRLKFTVAPLKETARNTKQGCCPVKIIESMAAGTPVVASNLRVCRELIDSRINGLLIPPGDKRSLIKAIIEMFEDDDQREKLAEEALLKARKLFNHDYVHEEINRIIMETKNSFISEAGVASL